MALDAAFQLFAEATGLPWQGWLRALARVSSLLLLVPIFGGAALPVVARLGLGLALAATIAPALPAASAGAAPWWSELFAQFAQGLPVAIGAALLLHVTLMSGAIVDELRGARALGDGAVFDGEQTPLGLLLGLVMALSLLESGAVTRLTALLLVSGSEPSLLQIARQLSASIGFAVAISAPIAALSIVLSAAEALIARAASPADLLPVLAPARSVVVLAAAALLLDRLIEALLLLKI